MKWYPLKLTVHIRTYAFGERLIPEKLGKPDLPEGRVAETWEVSDYRETTGTVRNGALAGQTLHSLVERYPDELVGRNWRGPHFPLLAKFLDASHMLPVHLHADDATARRVHGAANGKTEAWHILWATPGATILAGVKPGLQRADLFAAFKAEDYDSVMFRYPIQAGDTVYVPGGVIHSFGPNTLIFEIQQTSDLAQSVMPGDLYGDRYPEHDWDAKINAALDELRTDFLPHPHGGLALPDLGANRYLIGCAGPYFALERWTIHEPHRERLDGRRCLTVSNVGDPLTIEHEGGSETLARGESCILPAALSEATLTPIAGGSSSLIVCYVPDLARDIVDRLTEAGHPSAAIRSLGELR
ncbi:MAG TPA: type I phosphomannose isomerase catalytic subunit [Chloroflexota bacterium]|nr:type I phosphomannose isomerase catalytic subunit [Chloroflexota bacterium]